MPATQESGGCIDDPHYARFDMGRRRSVFRLTPEAKKSIRRYLRRCYQVRPELKALVRKWRRQGLSESHIALGAAFVCHLELWNSLVGKGTSKRGRPKRSSKF